MFKYIIIGAGFAGATMAERIAEDLGEKVLVVERRNHIGGNAYDRYDSSGVLIHQYGPHIFHTKIKRVWDYLSRFTEWNLYHHRVLGAIDGQEVPVPINLNSLRSLLPENIYESLSDKLVERFGYHSKIPILRLRDSGDDELNRLADLVYEKVFLHYTTKQWGVKPEELNPQVTGRVPVSITRDDRYFQDPYQGLPRNGYTQLFMKMLSHPNIKLLLNTDYKEIVEINDETTEIRVFGQPFSGQVIYTGKIDELLDYKLGELPYRSLRFEFETYAQEKYQTVGTVNYPNDYDFTRITEFKHLTGQKHAYTTIVKEYPQPYEREVIGKDVPYYPFPNEENHSLYAKYRGLAKKLKQITLIGRLAEYTYYDMDAVVAKALKVYDEKFAKGHEVLETED